MRELSLYTGSGGGLLGTKLLGWRSVGYVEFNSYCQRVIAQRIKDGYLDEAPIFSDIRAFNSEGFAKSYKGMVDVITGGFPCQPFSNAGKGLGKDDPRNMWPATIECIRAVRPRLCWLENVPALAVSGYFGTILGDLVEAGYDTRWRILSAAEVGAPHKRDRLWILAYPKHSSNDSFGRQTGKENQNAQRGWQTGQSRVSVGTGFNPEVLAGDVGNTESERLQRIGTGREQITQTHAGKGLPLCSSRGWWRHDPAEAEAESRVGRVAYGMANRVDRLKALGNGQVPAVVADAFNILMNRKEIV